MSESTRNYLQLLGRALLAAIFIVAGIRKALNVAGTAAYMAKNGVPFAEQLAIAAIALEIVGGLMLLLGWRTRDIAIVLAIFVAVITPIFHAFWTFDAAAYANQMNHFLKNLCVIGGMLYVAVSGPGKYSIDGGGKK